MQILLVEDDPRIARELRLRWQARGAVVHPCSSLSEANAALQKHFQLDLIVLDLGLPDGDGLQWLKQLRIRDRMTPVLVLTALDRVADRVAGLLAGADDYLIKPFHVDELDARVTALSRRNARESGELRHYGGVTWLGGRGEVRIHGELLTLAPREFEVLGLLMHRAPKLVPKRVLADALAERNLDVTDGAVEVYVSRLRRRLRGSGTTIRTVRGFGYHLVLEDAGGSSRAPEE